MLHSVQLKFMKYLFVSISLNEMFLISLGTYFSSSEYNFLFIFFEITYRVVPKTTFCFVEGARIAPFFCRNILFCSIKRAILYLESSYKKSRQVVIGTT